MKDLKETEIGLIPKDWEIIKFGNIAEFKNGINFPKSAKGEKGILTIDVKNMYGNGCYVNLDSLYRVDKKFSNDYNLISGDLLFVRSSLMQEGVGWTSLFKANNENVTFCGFIIRARINTNDFSKEYLTQYFRSDVARETLVAGSGKVAITNINQGLLSNLIIPKPKLIEQEAIAQILSTIQQSIEKQQQLIEATTELKRALMNKLFTEGTRGEKQKETEIGLVPESWEVDELGKHSEIKTSYPTLKKVKEKYNKNKGGEIFHYLKVSDMNLTGNEKYFHTSNIQFKNTNTENFKRGFIKPYSLVFPKRGGAIGTNKKRITTKYSVLDPNLIGVEPNDNLNTKYIFHFFEMFDLMSLQDNNVVPQLNKHNVAGVVLPLPSFEEQLKIVEIIEGVERKLNFHIQKEAAFESLFKSMLHELMTGKTRVKDVDFEEIGKEYKLQEKPLDIAAET